MPVNGALESLRGALESALTVGGQCLVSDAFDSGSFSKRRSRFRLN